MRLWKHCLLLAVTVLAVFFPGCGGCPGGIGIPPEPTQALITATKPDLPADDFLGLNILFKYYHEILTDGVHNIGGKFDLPSGKSVTGGT